MGQYLETVIVPNVDIIPNLESRTVTITGRKGSWTFFESGNITFDGINTTWQIYQLFPTGMTLISSDTSIPIFHSWKNWFKPPSIFIDAIHNTGWMHIN